MPTQQQIQNDVLFWLANQDKEHNLFFTLGFQDPLLRKEAQDLYDAYVKAGTNVDQLLAIAPRSQEFKRRAFAIAKQKWIGWIFPTFIDHTRREIDYALTRMTRDLTPQEETCFWTLIGAEHAAFAAHLLDPVEAGPIQEAMRNNAQLGQLHASCQNAVMPSFVELSKRAALELDKYFSGLNLKTTESVIHPVLAAHVVREGRRFVETMNALQQRSLHPAYGGTSRAPGG